MLDRGSKRDSGTVGQRDCGTADCGMVDCLFYIVYLAKMVCVHNRRKTTSPKRWNVISYVCLNMGNILPPLRTSVIQAIMDCLPDNIGNRNAIKSIGGLFFYNVKTALFGYL